MDNIQNNRLQLLRHEEIFATREEALDYIEANYKPEALASEPVVVFYGDRKSPNTILAIGTPNKHVFIIDATELKEAIEKNTTNLEKGDENMAGVLQSINEILKASGLVLDTNKIADRISYQPPVKDDVIGDATSIADAISKISEFVQKLGENQDKTFTESKTLQFTEEEDRKGNKSIVGEVKVSTEGDDDDVEFNDNIVGIKSDGLFAAVDIRYDEENNRIIFTSSGMKNGRFVTDAKRKVIDLGEPPTAKTVKYKGKTVFKALDELEKDMDSLKDMDIEVNSAQNTLKVTIGEFSKTVSLPGVDIIQTARYDHLNHNLVLSFKNGNSTTIPMEDFFKGTKFVNSDSVELHEHVEADGTTSVSAEVIISKREDNALRKDADGGLFVEASAVGGGSDITMRDVNDAIRVETDRAKDAERELKDTFNEKLKEETERSKEVEAEIKDLVKTETNRAKSRENEIEQLVKDEAVARERGDEKAATDLNAATTALDTKITTAVRDERERATGAENALTSQLEAEINERRAEVNRVETEVVPAVNNALSAKIQEEIDRAKDAERAIAESVVAEQSRAELKETEIEAKVTQALDQSQYASSQVSAISDAVHAETTRATEKEHAIELSINGTKEFLDKEIADRKEANAEQNAAIKEARDKITVLEGPVEQVGSIRNIIAEENRLSTEAIQNEVQRATTAEDVLAQRIDGIVSSGTDTLNTAKAYTDVETERAKEVENQIKGDVQALQAKDNEIIEALSGKITNVKLEKVGDNNLVYQLLVDGVQCGLLNIPQDNFFKGATFNENAHILTLNFTTDDGENIVDINMSSLVLAYKAGVGLALDEDGKFSINLNSQADEGYLFIDENGICVKGINAKLDTKADKGDSYTKEEADAEYEKLRGEDAVVKNEVTLLVNDAKTTISGEISAVDNKVEAEKSRAMAKEEYIEAVINAHKESADGITSEVRGDISVLKTKAETSEKAIADEKSRAELVESGLDGRLATAEEKLNTLNGAVGTPGAVLDNIQKAKDETNVAIADESARAKGEETKIRESVDNLNISLGSAITDAKDAAIAHTDTEIANLKTSVEQNAADIKTKVGTIQLISPEGSADYILMVDGKEIGTIRTQQRGGVLTSVDYKNGVLTLYFNVDGVMKSEQIDFNELLDDVTEYTAGDGLVLENGSKFKVMKDSLSEDFLSVSASGIGIHGVNAAITDAVTPVAAKADAATAKATSVESELNTVKASLETVSTKADDASASAREAKSAADAAKGTAEVAKSAADTAALAAQTATSKAESVDLKIDNVKTIAENAANSASLVNGRVDAVELTANSARTSAEAANVTANTASNLAQSATTAATTASNKADLVDGRVSTLDTKVNTISDKITGVEDKVKDIEKSIADGKDLDELKETVSGQATTIESLQTSLGEAQSELNAAKTKIAELEEAMDNYGDYGEY